MNRNRLLCAFFVLLSCAIIAPARADDFADNVDLAPLETIAVQHDQTMKTLDTFARQVISQIIGHSTIDGHSALYTMLDMSFRPELYVNRNIIKIGNVPLRQEFLHLGSINAEEKARIIHDGTVSLTFMERQDVQILLANAQSQSINKTKAVNELLAAYGNMRIICEIERPLIPAAIVPPATDAADDRIWHRISEMVGNYPNVLQVFKAEGHDPPKPLDHYEDRAQLLNLMFDASVHLYDAWAAQDAAAVNSSAKALADILPRINPAVYPSHAKLRAEVVYNHLMKLTIPGAAFYFMAMVLFLMSSQSGFISLRLWALRLMMIGLIIHTIGIGIRWWLVGDIFPPIKNEFESVMFSAWFGAVVGMVLELRRSRGIFGAAASFVGTLSLVAIFAAPYVAGREIGGEINQVQGILMSYWLYIHVTMVTASYALIGMGFMLSLWWLIRYYMDYGTLRLVSPTLLSSDGIRATPPSLPGGGGRRVQKNDGDLPMPEVGTAVALGFAQTLGMMLFMPQAGTRVEKQRGASAKAVGSAQAPFLAMLDQCNLVVLQLAFWVLGAGIICGAIWADQSWGRPWGWDPKETFALVTWITYLIVVHVRIATENKAWWTAVLSCIGFFIMLFNWIGVNFLLVGLHSYA